MFKALIGDMFQSNAQTLVNTVNCVGVMGKGVALEFKKRYPEMFKDYIRRCDLRQVNLGEHTFIGIPPAFASSISQPRIIGGRQRASRMSRAGWTT